jgi:anti-anti-sigma regulatory factor
MYVKTQEAGAVRLLEPHGKLLLGKSQAPFENAVQKALDEGWKKIVINLKYVPAIDSAGLASIIRFCSYRADERGAKVKIIIPRSSPLPLHVRTPIALLFGAHEAVLEAVGSFAREPRPAQERGREKVHEA